jgi:type II secretion system protein G
MNRSFPLAESSVGSWQPSVCLGFLPRTFSRHTPHESRHPVRHLGAFTLIEIMVTIALVAILAGLTMASFGYVNKKAADSKARAEVAALSAAIDRYQADFGTYPANKAELFQELVGEGTINTNTLYFEPSDASRKAQAFLSPWGTEYEYNSSEAEQLRNVGSFDLWVEPPDAQGEEDWIHN